MENTIHPIANGYEIHFVTDIVDRSISVVEYDTINETKTQLAMWSGGHWIYRNPMQYNKFDKLCRTTPKLRRALKIQMAYLRDPYNNQRDITAVNNFGRRMSAMMHKTLKLFVAWKDWKTLL